MVGNSARIRRSRCLTWDDRWLSRAITPEGEADRAQQHRRQHPAVAAERAEQAYAAAAPKPTSPHTTCSTRNSWTVLSRPARSSRRRTDVAPPRTASTPRPPSAGTVRTRRRVPTRSPRARCAGREGGRPAGGRGRTAGTASWGLRITSTRETTSSSPPAASAPSRAPHNVRLTAGSAARRAAGRSASSASRPPRRARRRPPGPPRPPARRSDGSSDWNDMISSTSQGRRPPAGAVDGPGLSRLHLRAGAGVVAQVARQVAQQPAELAAADLAGDPGASTTVADRVGQLVLQPVEALAEPPVTW